MRQNDCSAGHAGISAYADFAGLREGQTFLFDESPAYFLPTNPDVELSGAASRCPLEWRAMQPYTSTGVRLNTREYFAAIFTSP